jgi:hypothetical protein
MYVSNNPRLRHRTFLPASVPACICHHPPLTSSSSHIHKPFCGNFHSLSALLWQLPLFVCPSVATSSLCLTGSSSLVTLLLLLRAGPRVAPTDLCSQETKNLRRRVPQASPRCRHCRRRPPASPPPPQVSASPLKGPCPWLCRRGLVLLLLAARGPCPRPDVWRACDPRLAWEGPCPSHCSEGLVSSPLIFRGGSCPAFGLIRGGS